MSKKILTGKVISTKMQKTVNVAVDASKPHPLYSKVVKKTKKVMARDEIGVKEGDIVRVEESVPYSKNVKWKVIEVVEEEK